MNYITEFIKNTYELIDPVYARNWRMEKFNELKESGQLEQMCIKEVHELFKIRKYSNEF